MNTKERLRILYVEDNCDSVDMVRVLLGLSRVDMECAESVGEAMSLVASERYDLFLLDTGLPDGSGLDLCRTLRAVEPTTPVLFYSGDAHPDEISKGIAAGADGYITKPNSDKLASTIIQLVTNRREQSLASNPFQALGVAA